MIEQILPTVFFDKLELNQGLILLSGYRNAKIGEVLENSLKSSKKSIFWKNHPRLSLKSPQNCDVVIVEIQNWTADFEMLLNIVEEGKLLIVIDYSPCSYFSLQRFWSGHYHEARLHLFWRFYENLQLMIGQHRLKETITSNGDQVQEIFGFEVYLITEELRKYLKDQDFTSLEKIFMGGVECKGSINLNQVLFQFLLRRKIDLKEAFKVSRNPTHFDLLLKQAGI